MKVAVFRSAAAALDGAGVEWWLSDGTALGCHRDGAFIDSDGDVDLGVWREDIPKAAAVLGGAAGRNFAHQIWRSDRGVKVDVHGHERDGDTVFFRLGQHSNMRYEFPARLFDTFQPATFYGHPVRLPSPIDEYLTVHYGDWQTPVTEWKWDASPPCLTRTA